MVVRSPDPGVVGRADLAVATGGRAALLVCVLDFDSRTRGAVFSDPLVLR